MRRPLRRLGWRLLAMVAMSVPAPLFICYEVADVCRVQVQEARDARAREKQARQRSHPQKTLRHLVIRYLILPGITGVAILI